MLVAGLRRWCSGRVAVLVVGPGRAGTCCGAGGPRCAARLPMRLGADRWMPGPVASRVGGWAGALAAAFAFLLSALAARIATVAVVPGRSGLVAVRFVTSVLTAMAVGRLWLRFARPDWTRLPERPDLRATPKWTAF